MNCCKCGKEANIVVSEVGDFCHDCHNLWVSEQYGIKAEFEYTNEFEVYDKNIGRKRFFQLQHLNLGHCTSWMAKESPTGYVINHISYPGDNPMEVVSGFISKIESTVASKTLDNRGTLKMKGNISITWDSESEQTSVCIDDKEMSLHKFGEMLSSYEGWKIQYRIVDASDCVLKADELLMPVKVGYDVLMEELERNISMMEDGNNFIKYSDIMVFETLFYNIFEKLELMKNSEEYMEEAVRTAKAMIERVENLETDDDYFPCNLIEQLNELIEK